MASFRLRYPFWASKHQYNFVEAGSWDAMDIGFCVDNLDLKASI